MNRSPYRKSGKKRPTLKALIKHRPPKPGRTAGGIGREYVYPTPEPCRYKALESCDLLAHYHAISGNGWDEEGP